MPDEPVQMTEDGKPMTEKTNRSSVLRLPPSVKAALLAVLAAIAIGVVEFSPFRDYLRPDRLQAIINEAGIVGPALLAVLSAVGTCVFIPGTFFVGVGVAAFGPFPGFVCVWPGILAGAALSYLAARKLGREFVRSVIGDRLAKYDELIERNGFRAILLLRLMFVPLAPLNYASGLTRVRFWDYFFATALGEAATILVVVFFIGEIRRILISEGADGTSFLRLALSIVLLTALGVVAKVLKSKYGKGN